MKCLAIIIISYFKNKKHKAVAEREYFFIIILLFYHHYHRHIQHDSTSEYDVGYIEMARDGHSEIFKEKICF